MTTHATVSAATEAGYAVALVQLAQTRAALTAIAHQATEGETFAALAGRRDLVRCFAAISRQCRRALMVQAPQADQESA